MKKRLPVIIAVLMIITICTALYFTLRKHDNPNELTLYGNIEIRQVDLSFQVSGQILKMLKEEGDSVKAGELVAILDDRDYKSNLDKSSAEVKRALALKNDAASKYERNIPLCYDNTISKEECDTLTNNKDKTAADYDASLAAEQFARNQLAYTKIFAPEPGVVMVRVQEPGAIVNKGQLVYTMSKINLYGLEHM